MRSSTWPHQPSTACFGKSNLLIKLRSKAKACLYEFLCYYSLTSPDSLREELLSYLPTRFHSHTFDYIVYEHSSDDESVHSLTRQFLHSLRTTKLVF